MCTSGSCSILTVLSRTTGQIACLLQFAGNAYREGWISNSRWNCNAIFSTAWSLGFHKANSRRFRRRIKQCQQPKLPSCRFCCSGCFCSSANSQTSIFLSGVFAVNEIMRLIFCWIILFSTYLCGELTAPPRVTTHVCVSKTIEMPLKLRLHYEKIINNRTFWGHRSFCYGTFFWQLSCFFCDR